MARFATVFARSLTAAMLSYHLFVVTNSYGALGLLGLIEFLPVIPVSLFAGAVADRMDRRWLLVGAATAGTAGCAILTWIAWQHPESMVGLLGVAFSSRWWWGFRARPAARFCPIWCRREFFRMRLSLNPAYCRWA